MGETQRWLSNSHMRAALRVAEDLLGHNGQTAVLRLSGLERYIDHPPPDDDRREVPRGDLTMLFSGIASTYGDQGARGVLRRWGRVFAARRLQRHTTLRALRFTLRLARPDRAARFALSSLLHHLDLVRGDRRPALEESGEFFFLQLDDCLYAYGQQHAQPGCPAVVGLLEGMLRWACGKDFEVSEEPPAAPGAPVFKIRKRPLGPH
jgi:hypothetical protein